MYACLSFDAYAYRIGRAICLGSTVSKETMVAIGLPSGPPYVGIHFEDLIRDFFQLYSR